MLSFRISSCWECSALEDTSAGAALRVTERRNAEIDLLCSDNFLLCGFIHFCYFVQFWHTIVSNLIQVNFLYLSLRPQKKYGKVGLKVTAIDIAETTISAEAFCESIYF